MKMFCILFIILLFHLTIAAPQQPEINDQFEADTTQNQVDDTTKNEVENMTELVKIDGKQNEELRTEIEPQEESFSVKIYKFVSKPIIQIINAPRVNNVLRNIGTCMVNGAMDLISYYLPAPIIPLIASAAGMIIPFEPIVMLKQKMPVTSYRRAFITAMNSFMNTFDKYKVDDDYDPYMTRRFNRRFMNDDKKVKK